MADRIDIPSFQIAASKMRADGGAYFKLFEKHVPRNLGLDSVVLLYKLDNLSCIYKIVNMNSKAHYVVISNDAVNTALQAVLDKAIDVKYIEEFDFKETDMKFDCIVMNPPYSRNLHLKILAEAIKHLKDESSVCVNLSPCEWLMDTLNEIKSNNAFNKYQDSILSYLSNFEIIDAEVGNKIFNIGLMADLGLYVCKSNCVPINAQQIKWTKVDKTLFDKLIHIDKKQFPDIIKFNEKKHKYFVPLKLIANPYRTTAFNICTSTFKWLVNGKLPNGESWHTGIYKSKSMRDISEKQLYGIAFDSENEAKNFYNSTYTACFKYANMMVKRFNQHVNIDFLPWLGDAANPRTKLKGYKGEWTDADLYQFFNITPEEQKTIEETMEKYK